MSLAVVVPGVFSTIQDLGRDRHRSWGVPVGGSFDAASAMLANALVGSPADCAVLEMTYVGGVYEARAPMALALAGAPMKATLRPETGRDVPLEPASAFPLKTGERLVIEGTAQGARTYLAVGGGWKTEVILGSRSSEFPLKAGDILPCEPGSTPRRRVQGFPTLPTAGEVLLRVTDGPDVSLVEESWLNPERRYRVGSLSDRMGMRLEGARCDVEEKPERLSTPVAPGSIQMAGGIPLILGVACGTMGGYPHVAQVITADLSRQAQARIGDRVRFERISVDEARHVCRSWRHEIRMRAEVVRMISIADIDNR